MNETRTKKDEVIAHALEKCDLAHKTKQILMVGDRKHDILGAAVHGIDGLGVTFGYGSQDELTKAGAKVRTFVLPTNEEYMIALDTYELTK